MTHFRTPGSVEHALHGVIRRLSPDVIEAFTGKEEDTLRKKSNPVNGGPLSLPDAARLDAALEANRLPPVFIPLMEEIKAHALRGQPTAPCRPADPLELHTSSVKEHAEALQAHARAAKDGDLEAARRALKEIEESKAAMEALAQDIYARFPELQPNDHISFLQKNARPQGAAE